jgi:hypothetical protein
MRQVSQKEKLTQVSGMLGTSDLSAWEASFIESLQKISNNTTEMSDKQAEKLDQIWSKNFA